MLPLLELKKNLDSSILLDAVYLTDVGLTHYFSVCEL